MKKYYILAKICIFFSFSDSSFSYKNATRTNIWRHVFCFLFTFYFFDFPSINNGPSKKTQVVLGWAKHLEQQFMDPTQYQLSSN
jgi:hypothetical protein